VTKIVFLLTPGLHLLDLAGPAQVFGTGADHGHPYELVYAAERTSVRTHQGLTLAAVTDLPRTGPDDLVVVPGWRGPLAAGEIGPCMVRLLRDHHAGGGTVVSVCAGRTRWAGPGSSTAGAAPPTTACRPSWPAGTPGRSSCRTSCS
jgi:putative intracellular protease/amidase